MSNKFVTPIGRVSYPYLFKSKFNNLSKKNEYSVDLLFEKSQNIDVIKNAIKNAIKERWGANPPKNLKLPLKDGDSTKPNSGTPYGEEYHGCYFVTLKNSKIKPQIVDKNKVEIIEDGEVYGGCYGRASVVAYAYPKVGEKAINSGVSLSLINFQKTGEGEAFGGARSDAFEDFDEISTEADDPNNYTSEKSMLD